ncbi:MAG: lipase family protein [Pseudomonadota bacterium]
MKNLFYESAVLCELAYADPADAETGTKAMGYENFRFIENKETDTQAFVCSKEDFAMVAFRGTVFDNWDDWMTNLEFGFAECPFGMVHAGFWQAMESVYQDILFALVQHIVHHRRIIVTGHSQGAGDAVAFAIKYLAEGRDIERVIHFGGPQTVNGQAAKHLDNIFKGVFHRVVNNNDLVTRIPPRSAGYRHFGSLHYFTEDRRYTTKISGWGAFLDRIKGTVADIGEAWPDCVKDHFLDDYIDLCGFSMDEEEQNHGC